MVEEYLPLAAGVLGVLMIYVSYLVVRGQDLVYSSASLAILGMLNALMIGLLGYHLVAVFLVVVYVGAAVMFIIITVSMLGGRDVGEEREESLGMFAGGAVLTVALLLVGTIAAYMGYTKPQTVQVTSVAEALLGSHAGVIALLFIALAATLVEAISIAVPRKEEG